MTPNLQTDFVAAANKMAEVIAKVFPAIQLHRRQRGVASTQTSGRGGGGGRGRGGRGGRGGGRGGRGAGRGRGGRGRGGAQGGNTFIPGATWWAMSQEERDKTLADRERVKRNISRISTTPQTSNVAESDAPSPNANAGVAFGRDSYTGSGSNRRARTATEHED